MASPSSPGAATEAGSGRSRCDVVAPFLLHDALERKEPLSVLQEILRRDPASVQRTCVGDWWRGYLPLHIAAYFNAPVEVVRLLVDKHPVALQVPTPHGHVPLHLAAQQKDVEVIQLLVDRCPAALLIKDRIGRLPLEIAQRAEAPVGVLQLLSPNNDAYLSLLYVAHGPKVARVFLGFADFVQKALGGREEGKKGPPLHVAIDYFADRREYRRPNDATILQYLDDVQTVAERRPKAVMEKDPGRGLPLHRAVVGCISFTRVLVRRLADACPPALMVKDDDKGWVPLHAAARCAKWDVVQLLVEKCPLALEVKDRAGWLPLHVAAHYDNVKVVKCLADAFPKALEVQDNIGCLPFHLAVRRAKLEMVQLLADMSPEAVQVTDDDGYFPLHIAAERGEADIFQCVMESWPEALQQRTIDGWRPVHVAAFRGAPLDFVYGIVRASPLSLK